MDRRYLDYLKAQSHSAERILSDPRFSALSDYPRHFYTNTQDHSIRVAVCMAWFSERFGVDPETAVKTGLLHDMCYVNYHVKNDHPGLYCFYHPEEAADNAAESFGLTEEQAAAIRAHMFPLAVHVPKSRLALLLTLSDKAVAVYEGLYGIGALRRALQGAARKRVAPAA